MEYQCLIATIIAAVIIAVVISDNVIAAAIVVAKFLRVPCHLFDSFPKGGVGVLECRRQ
jgi:hypothetical protein